MGNVNSERLEKAIDDIKKQCDFAESAKEPEDGSGWCCETGILISRKDAENILLALANGNEGSHEALGDVALVRCTYEPFKGNSRKDLEEG
ncbi:MAG: hypothetical protein U5J63_01270 [Fodinibius sp.]|nr:hypothetical protein [Fodinibius sp.]